MKQYKDMKICFNEDKYKLSGDLVLEGAFSVFVNCGSQYAIWYQFPNAIVYTLRDLDTGMVYESINFELSISHSGSSVYDKYAGLPCDRIVTEKFETVISDICFDDPPFEEIKNYEIAAHYLGCDSNTLIVINKPVKLKRWN